MGRAFAPENILMEPASVMRAEGKTTVAWKSTGSPQGGGSTPVARRLGATSGMTVVAAIAAALLLVHPAVGEAESNLTTCGECHLRNDHTKDFSTAHPELLQVGRCDAYADGSCCTAETARKIFPPLEGQEVLYGEEWRPDRCGDLSPACARWFTLEECLYECDLHAGRFRVHENCLNPDGDPEAWRMFGMPIKASECNQWYEDCRDDLFCSCHGDAPCRESWMTPGSLFSFPELECSTESGECLKFSELYADGKEMCEKMWDYAFKYEENDDAAYSFILGPEWNEMIDHKVEFPQVSCNPNATSSDDQCEF